jgi:FHS family L-fucose permease-like MFS transporter
MTDVLLATFRKVMSMTDFQTSWIQVAFYGSYFCLAFPASVFIKRFSYKSGVLLGLGLFAAGALLFFPASQTMVYGHFLAALFILAGGLSILETSANPYVLAMGPKQTAIRRLNLAQSFNPIGSILGVVIGKLFILDKLNPAGSNVRAEMDPQELQVIQAEELSAVMGPYVVVALAIVAVWMAIAFSKMPLSSDSDDSLRLMATLKRLVKKRTYVLGVVAQFFYVGAQIGVWSFTIRYVMKNLGLDESGASNALLLSIVLFCAARFICTGLMRYVSPGKLLMGLALAAIALSALVVAPGGRIGVVALVGISACMSLMFPTIYGLAANGLGEDRKIGGSLLIMAILGGAALTAAQGQISDAYGIHTAYLVPLICFIVVALYGFHERSIKR